MQTQVRKTIMDSTYISDDFKYRIWPLYVSTLHTQQTRNKHSTEVYKICERYQKDFLELSKEDVQDYFNCLTSGIIKSSKNDYYSDNTIRLIYFQLYSVASFISENTDLIKEIKYSNPYAYVELKKRKLDFKKEELHSVNDMSALLSYLHGTPYYLMVSLVYRLGLSVKELVALKVSHFYFDKDNNLFVQPPVDAPIINSMQREPRTLKVPKDLEKLLVDHINSINPNQTYIFVSSRQTPYNINTLSNKMRTVFDKGGFTEYTLQNVRNAGQYALLNVAGKEHSKDITQQFGISERYIKRYYDAVDNSVSSISDKLQIELKPSTEIKKDKPHDT